MFKTTLSLLILIAVAQAHKLTLHSEVPILPWPPKSELTPVGETSYVEPNATAPKAAAPAPAK